MCRASDELLQEGGSVLYGGRESGECSDAPCSFMAASDQLFYSWITALSLIRAASVMCLGLVTRCESPHII